MKNFKSRTEKHYYQPNLFEEIVRRLDTMDVDIDHVSRSDIASVDEFHVRGAQVSRELAKTAGI